jgi:hypothetical protein
MSVAREFGHRLEKSGRRSLRGGDMSGLNPKLDLPRLNPLFNDQLAQVRLTRQDPLHAAP